MNTKRSVGRDLAGLAVVAAAIAVTTGCEWDAATAERYAAWDKTMKDVSDRAAAQKEKCNERSDRTAKEDCYKAWDKHMMEIDDARTAGVTAYFNCDASALNRILETLQDIVKRAAELAGKKAPLAPGGVATNLADPLDGSPVHAQIQAIEIGRDGERHTYQIVAGHVVVQYGGVVFDDYPASGQIVLDVVPGPVIAHCTLIDMDIVLDFSEQGTCAADLHVTEDASNPTVFDLQLAPGGSYDGRLCGWLDYALENWTLAGSYSTVLPVSLDPSLTQLQIQTPPGATSATVFPEDPAPTGPYIYYATFRTPPSPGRDATIVFADVEPLAPVDFYGSPRLSFPTGLFSDAAWDLNVPKQRLAGRTNADAAGEGSLTFRVPNKPSLVGRTFFFQGLAHESAGDRSTIAFSSPVVP